MGLPSISGYLGYAIAGSISVAAFYLWRDGRGGSKYRTPLELSAEMLLILLFYKAYGLSRNTAGSAQEGSMEVALAHAEAVIEFEKALGFFWEEQIQAAFLGWPSWIVLWNYFYASAHNTVTVFVIFFLFFQNPVAYNRCRTEFVILNTLAIVGFMTYPLMPPRLVPACDEYGGCLRDEYHFVDTMDVYGGLWSWKDKAVNDVSNHYAAMPSMHTGYAAWTCVSVFTTSPYRWLKVVAVLHPIFTVYCIIVTGNHYLVDAVAGGACFLAARKLAAHAPKYGRGASWTHVTWPARSSGSGDEAAAPGGAESPPVYARVRTSDEDEDNKAALV